MQDALSRRRFLVSGATRLSTAWVAANWPSALAAAQHAHNSVQSGVPPEFEFFTEECSLSGWNYFEISEISAEVVHP